MGEGPGLKKDEKKIRFWLTFAENDRIIYEYTGARDGAHQKKSQNKSIQPQKNFITQRVGRTLTWVSCR